MNFLNITGNKDWIPSADKGDKRQMGM